MSETLQKAKAELRTKIRDLVAEIKADPRMGQVLSHQAALNGIERVLGEAETSLSTLFSLPSGEAVNSQPLLAEDEFVNQNQLEAAKAYLRKVGKPPRTIEEIIEAVNTHGGKVTNPKDLPIQLARSTYQVQKVGEKWGLVEWYQGRKRPRRSKGGALIEEEGGREETEESEQPEAPVSNSAEGQIVVT